jgi:TRAP-type C4-dicarboxylate transport system permease small subunit
VITSKEQSGLLDKAEKFGRFVETASLVLILAAMIILAAAQIVMRNMLDLGLSWSDEALRLMVLWVTMLGAVAASRDRRHIVIDVLSRVLPAGPKVWASLVVDSFAAAVAGVLAWYAALFVADSREFGDLLLNDFPAWPFQLILPIAFTVIAYRYGIWSVRHLRDIIRGADRS